MRGIQLGAKDKVEEGYLLTGEEEAILYKEKKISLSRIKAYQ